MVKKFGLVLIILLGLVLFSSSSIAINQPETQSIFTIKNPCQTAYDETVKVFWQQSPETNSSMVTKKYVDFSKDVAGISDVTKAISGFITGKYKGEV